MYGYGYLCHPLRIALDTNRTLSYYGRPWLYAPFLPLRSFRLCCYGQGSIGRVVSEQIISTHDKRDRPYC